MRILVVVTLLRTHWDALQESRVYRPLFAPSTSVCATLIHTQHTHGRALILTLAFLAGDDIVDGGNYGKEQWRNRRWAKQIQNLCNKYAVKFCFSITGSRVCLFEIFKCNHDSALLLYFIDDKYFLFAGSKKKRNLRTHHPCTFKKEIFLS